MTIRSGGGNNGNAIRSRLRTASISQICFAEQLLLVYRNALRAADTIEKQMRI